MNETLLNYIIDLFRLYLKAQVASTQVEQPKARAITPMEAYDASALLDDKRHLSGFRVYDLHEEQMLDKDCRGMLMQLEQLSIITPAVRELVIENIECNIKCDVGVEELRLVVLDTLRECGTQETHFMHDKALLFFDQRETARH